MGRPAISHTPATMSAPVLVDTKGYTAPRVDTDRESLKDDEKSIESGEASAGGNNNKSRAVDDRPDDVHYGTQEANEHGLNLKNHLGNPSEEESVILEKWYTPPDAYENKHRWDPRFKWTPEEEKKLTRRLDLRVTFIACICFAALQLDRGNINNALSDGMLKDLNLTTYHCACGAFADLYCSATIANAAQTTSVRQSSTPRSCSPSSPRR